MLFYACGCTYTYYVLVTFNAMVCFCFFYKNVYYNELVMLKLK